MSIRDRMIDVIVADAEGSADAVRALATKVVDAQLAACPEVRLLDSAVLRWLVVPSEGPVEPVLCYAEARPDGTPILAIELPKAAS